MKPSHSICVVATAVFALTSSAIQAATITSATSGSWTTAATWAGGVVPTAADDVVISGHNVSLPAAETAQSLTLSAAGTLSGSGSLTVGTFTWNDGRLGGGGGSLTVTTSASIATASNDHALSDFTLNNQGTMTWASGAGELNFVFAAVFNNSGTLDIQNNAGIRWDNGSAPTINNSGTIRKSAGSGTSVFGVGGLVNIPFNNNSGTLDVQTGLLQIAGPATLNGTGAVTSGTVVLSSGANTVSNGAVYTGAGYWRLPPGGGLAIAAGSSSVRNIELSGGTINGAGALTLTGNLKWNSGGIGGGAGSVTIVASATLDVLTPSNSHVLSGFILNNQGLATWASGAGELNFINAAIFNNSGTLDIQNDAGIRWDNGSAPTINNSGTIRKSAGSGTSVFGVGGLVNIPFNNNSGTLDVQTGLLQITGAATLNGTGAVTSGTVVLSSGANTISSGAVYTGAGYWRLSGGLDIAAGSSSVRNIELSGGTINGSGALTLSGNLKWNNGSIGQGAGSVTIGASATLDVLTASNSHDLSAFTLNNQGLATWASGAGELHFCNAAVFNNSGTLDIQNDTGIRYDCGGPPTINNSGIFKKSAGSGTNIIGIISGFPFDNSGGTIDVQIGGINIVGTFTQNASSQLKFGIGGTTPLTQFGTLSINGTAPFAGATLTANLTGGFTPTPGQTFQVMTFGSSTGAFGTKNLTYPGEKFHDAYTPTTLTLIPLLCGDANGDGQVTVADVFYMINNLFVDGPPPVNSFDVNGDGNTTVADIFYMINFLFASGAAPICP